MGKLRRYLLVILLLLGAAGAGFSGWLLAGLPSPRAVEERLLVPSVRITDKNGRLLYDVIDAHSGRHTHLPLHNIPLTLQQATIATEDKNFYRNPGVDIAGIGRAFWINLRGGEVLAGGSTITQQVARNLLLDDEERTQRTLRRKLRESWLAWRMARTYGKDEILTLYLNQMYYGAMAYGVEAAAQTYFGKAAADLTLAESALLAGLPQAPARYNPFVDAAAAKERQLVVLDLMRKEGYITAEAQELAARQPLHYAATPYPVMAPHFVMMVQAELDTLFSQEDIYRSGGLTVRTTLDLAWQQRAEAIIREQLRRLNAPTDGGRSHNAHNAALVALNPRTGAIRALVGNADYFDEAIGGAINMALVPRQPGSALKPLIYAAAMDPKRPHPWTAATMIPDVHTAFVTHDGQAYAPVNFSRRENGPVLLRQALGASLNIPAVLALDEVGLEQAMAFTVALGVAVPGDPDDYDLSFALGGGAVRLLDLTTAYAAFANGGSRIVPYFIVEVVDAEGTVVYTADPSDPVRVIDERLAWLVSDILSDDDARRLGFGTHSILNLDRPAAVKTGTTNDFHDNWTVGYTPDLVTGVWVGNATNEPMRDVTGLSGAGPIWHYFMRAALAGEPETPFTQPPGLVQAEICALSGLLPGDACPYRRKEWFIAGTQPTETDTFFKRVTLDSATGLPADETTPPEREMVQLVLDLPPRLHPWARAQGLTLLDDLLLAAETSQETAVAASAPLRLVSPDPYTIYRLSPSLPPDSQRLRIEAVSTADLHDITLWLDDAPLKTFTDPPFETWWPLAPGSHRVWAEGRHADGTAVTSPAITFTVHDDAE